MAITLQTRKRIRLLEETLDLLPKRDEVPAVAREVLDRMRAGRRQVIEEQEETANENTVEETA